MDFYNQVIDILKSYDIEPLVTLYHWDMPETLYRCGGLLNRDFAGWFFDAGQPTTHYNVLRERGEDTRLIRVDEAAPLYYITSDFKGELPSLQMIVADGDMPSRPEQNLLLRAALLHFGYPAEKIGFRVMRGYGHCGYGGEEKDGRRILGKMITDFIKTGPFGCWEGSVFRGDFD